MRRRVVPPRSHANRQPDRQSQSSEEDSQVEQVSPLRLERLRGSFRNYMISCLSGPAANCGWSIACNRQHTSSLSGMLQSYRHTINPELAPARRQHAKANNHCYVRAELSHFCSLLFKDSLESKPMTVSKCWLFTKAAIAGRFRMLSSLHLSQFS